MNWDDHEFHHYTRGRWVFDEEKNLRDRYVSFDIDELIKVATKALGLDPSACIHVAKLPEGEYSKALLLTMGDGRQIVAKLPNPNAGRAFYVTASEVATMTFMKNVAGIPVPKVYDWNARLGDNNPVGAEYIIMEKAEGVLLSAMWPVMNALQKHQLVMNIISYETSLLEHWFEGIGSLYFATDLVDSQDRCIDTRHSGFVIGPSTSLEFVTDGRDAIQSDTGPWATTSDLIAAQIQREEDCIRQIHRTPRPEGIFGGPRFYRPSAAEKLAVLADFKKVVPYTLPDASISMPVLWHRDLHNSNIFVDPDDPSKVLSIIDWQGVHISPLYKQVRTPAFLDFEGPKPEVGLTQPSLPENFDQLGPAEQDKARDLRIKQTLYKVYELQSGRQNMAVLKALHYTTTIEYGLIEFACQVFFDGAPIVRGFLIKVALEWKEFVKDALCPLLITQDDDDQNVVDRREWDRGVAAMEKLLDALGKKSGWTGWVSHKEYGHIKQRLKIVKEQFLDEMAGSIEEREAWARVFPFQDRERIMGL